MVGFFVFVVVIVIFMAPMVYMAFIVGPRYRKRIQLEYDIKQERRKSKYKWYNESYDKYTDYELEAVNDQFNIFYHLIKKTKIRKQQSKRSHYNYQF